MVQPAVTSCGRQSTASTREAPDGIVTLCLVPTEEQDTGPGSRAAGSGATHKAWSGTASLAGMPTHGGPVTHVCGADAAVSVVADFTPSRTAANSAWSPPSMSLSTSSHSLSNPMCRLPQLNCLPYRCQRTG